MQIMRPTTVLALMIPLIACSDQRSSFSPIASASAQTPKTPIPMEYCGAGISREFEGYLELLSSPCKLTYDGIHDYQSLDSDGREQVVTLTLQQPMRVQLIRLWQGTAGESTMEVGVNLNITWPDGKHMLFISEFDKHADLAPADTERWINVHLKLPVGTVLQLSRNSYPFINCGNYQCATQEMAQLYGE